MKSANGRPLGWQESTAHFPVPYDQGHLDARPAGRLRRDRRVRRHDRGREVRPQLADEFLSRRPRHVDRHGRAPYAYVVSADQRDNFGTYEMLDILQFGAVEIHRATAAFSANGKQYPAGSFVIKTAQPYGGFANTMLSVQDYPDLRLFPGGPPEPPYDVTGHTLWMLTGVNVDTVAKPFEVSTAFEPDQGEGQVRAHACLDRGPCGCAGGRASADARAHGRPGT